MQINRKSRRNSTQAAEKAKKGTEPGRVRADKASAKALSKKGEAASAKSARHDRLERTLRDELEGTGAAGRVREIVTRLLGDERSPAVDALVARLQKAAQSNSVSPYGA